MVLTTEAEKKEFSSKNTYTQEEKEYIMQRLNAQRLEEQQESNIHSRHSEYTASDKQNILREINDKRLEKQLYREIEMRRSEKKKVYHFDLREFYKFLHMDREYYIETKEIKTLTRRPQILTLFHRTFGEMKAQDFLIKIEVYSDKIYLSSDMLRVYFKAHSLENAR